MGFLFCLGWNVKKLQNPEKGVIFTLVKGGIRYINHGCERNVKILHIWGRYLIFAVVNKKIKEKTMTFQELMAENGYECKTTFWSDFSIADRFGIKAVNDTFNRAFKEWKNNVVYVTELTLVLNHKIWQHHTKNNALARAYNELWYQCNCWCNDNLKGEDAAYFYRVTD